MFNPASIQFSKPIIRPLLLLGASMVWLAMASSAHAQYKYVAADGSVTYSDRPAPPDARSVVGIRPNGALVAAPEDELPFAVKQASSKYPVTIYTAADCPPCNFLKQHLAKRGVPFSEKILRTAADNTAFKNLGFSETSLPAVSVGSQKQTGFEAGALDGLLDIAGYPKSAKLPANYAAKSETLTPEPAAKMQVKVAESSSAQSDTKTAPKKDLTPTKPKEPAIRF